MTSIISDGGAANNNINSEDELVSAFESATGDKLVALVALPNKYNDLYPVFAPSSRYDDVGSTGTRIYTKYFTGTFRAAASDHRDVQITHGLTLSKILNVTAKVQTDCALSMYAAANTVDTVAALDAGTSATYVSLKYDATKIYLSNFYLSQFMTVPKTYVVKVDYTA